MEIGYARVSTTTQSLDVQRAALAAAGIDKIFEEKISGKSADDRPELQALVEFAREGDRITVTTLCRFARSTRDLHNLIAVLDGKGVTFRCLDQSIDTSTGTGRFTLSILAAVAQLELQTLRTRQREGIAAARAKSPHLYKGRQSTLDLVKLKQLSERGMKPTEIAAVMNISRATAYRALATIAASEAEKKIPA